MLGLHYSQKSRRPTFKNVSILVLLYFWLTLCLLSKTRWFWERIDSKDSENQASWMEIHAFVIRKDLHEWCLTLLNRFFQVQYEKDEINRLDRKSVGCYRLLSDHFMWSGNWLNFCNINLLILVFLLFSSIFHFFNF